MLYPVYPQPYGSGLSVDVKWGFQGRASRTGRGSIAPAIHAPLRGLFMPIHGGTLDLALLHWRQPIEKIWPVAGLKLWSPAPGVPSDVITNEELRSEWWR